MHDHNERFARLMEAVEDQGGELMPGSCRPRTIVYQKDKDHVKVSQGNSKTTGCNLERRFLVPDLMYVEEVGDAKTTTACMLDDRMDLWPRFADAIYGEAA